MSERENRADVSEMDTATLAYELGEARAELRRHHQDFERIQKALDSVEEANPNKPNEVLLVAIAALALIRGVVG
jgi:hypothetical protein